MIADSSEPNKYTTFEARHHPKTENLLYQNQSHCVYHIFEVTHPFAIERCKSKKGETDMKGCMLSFS